MVDVSEPLDPRFARLLASARAWRAVRAEGGDPRKQVEGLLLAVGAFDEDDDAPE